MKEPFFRFSIHVLVGSAVITMITGMAVMLHLLVVMAISFDVSVLVGYSLRITEVAIFLLDLSLFVVFITKSSFHMAKDMLKGDVTIQNQISHEQSQTKHGVTEERV